MQACLCNKVTCSKVLTKLCMLLRQYTTHQGFSRRFLLLPKIQQRALTFFWPLNASVIGHNGCRISVIGGHVARSNYKKVKGYAKWVLTFQACAEVSSRENQNLLTWQKKSCLSASGGTCSLVQYTFQRAAPVHVEGCSTCVLAKASNLEFCGSRHASSQEESFTRWLSFQRPGLEKPFDG